MLGRELRDHLALEACHGSVYDEPSAFERFIRGGGNIGLYSATSFALATVYDDRSIDTLVDLGCGDGAAVAPALRIAAAPPTTVDLVEPSAELLDKAVEAVSTSGASVTANRSTAEQLVASLTDERWDLLESTFALHAIEPSERTRVLRALRTHVGAMAIVEFDVPDLDHASPEHLRSLAARYERGLGEYGDDAPLVAQGFLMSVLVGQLAPSAPRATWEQPAARWVDQLRSAGFGTVEQRPVADYWWSPAVLFLAA